MFSLCISHHMQGLSMPSMPYSSMCMPIVLCNINWYNDMVQWYLCDDANGPYIFSLLPCILVWKVHDHVSA